MSRNDSNSDSSATEQFANFARTIFGIGSDDGEEGRAKIATVSQVDTEPGYVTRWSLGSHTMTQGRLNADKFRNDLEMLKGVDDDLAEVLEGAAEMVETRKIGGFECPICGLNHGHSDGKHDIRAAFNVSEEFADEMPWCPYCHCGVNWLAEVIDFTPYTERSMFGDEDEFEPFINADPSQFTTAIEQLRASHNSSTEKASIQDALETAGLEQTDEMVKSLDRYFTRYMNILNAADNAPIASETQEKIQEQRELLAEGIEESSEEEDDRSLGTITHFNSYSSSGYISSDDHDDVVTFNTTDADLVGGTTVDDITEGAEVLFTAEERMEIIATEIEVTS